MSDISHSLVSVDDLATSAARVAVSAPVGTVGSAKIWRLFHFPTPTAAVNFANVYPVQVAGEFGMTDSPNGGVDGYYFFETPLLAPAVPTP